MDGSSLSLIVIPVVVLASLAAWLIIVYYACSHPLWQHHQQASPDVGSQPAALAGRRSRSPESAPQRRAA
jgi:hypothetical protein